MGSSTKVLVNGAITTKQLYNALERINVKPLVSEKTIGLAIKESSVDSSFLPIAVGSENRNLFITFIENDYFREQMIKELPDKSRKLKASKNPVLLISLGHNDMAVKVLTRLAYELGGGYIVENDCSGDYRDSYREVKGK